ncbi:MAG: magnesium transporter [Alphaproteobacteria bacterium]|nr:magnesium transporter [Alphaproteobacteria bacterium]
MSQENQNIATENEIDESLFHLTDENIKDIVDAVESQDSDIVTNALEDLSDADTAELISKIDNDSREELLNMYGETLAPTCFLEMDTELQRITLSSMPAHQVASIITELESDDALELIMSLDEDYQNKIIRKLNAKLRVVLEEGLSFPEDSAGRLMQREVVSVPELWTAGKTIDYLRAASNDLPDDFSDLFIIDPAHHVIGQVPVNRLIRAKRGVKINEIMLTGLTQVPATMDQEDVAHLFRREDILSAPVVDEEGRLIGVVTIDDVVDVIDTEAQEDLMKMVGVEQGDFYRAIWATTGNRFRWLFVNLLTAILASIVISFFDVAIEKIVALAILMPIVASMGGNAGTQALTVAVRALATRELSTTNTWRMIWKETIVGSLNGLAFAIITGVITALWFSSPMLGGVIAAAMIINLFAAGFFGVTIPIYLDKAGKDPAVASTVFLTTITDVVGFFAFLGLAAIFLM